MCINYQQGRGWTCVKSDVINSSYNIHNHTSSCFGKDIISNNNKKTDLNLKKKPEILNVDTNIHVCHVKEQQLIMLMTYNKNGTHGMVHLNTAM